MKEFHMFESRSDLGITLVIQYLFRSSFVLAMAYTGGGGAMGARPPKKIQRRANYDVQGDLAQPILPLPFPLNVKKINTLSHTHCQLKTMILNVVFIYKCANTSIFFLKAFFLR